ncbi:hypothetical protein [Halorussus salinisoli]|uniref:hypothetical protein n=1 Tax=Halorussus salinisoli TaxID=2558242 RepID=UPI0010C1CA85|nr:hypothetical protein [Halorussus salinisoli]
MKRRVFVALLVLAAVAPAATPASSPPQPLCPVCDDGFEQAADERGLNATVARSEAVVRVREDATGRWTVRNHLTNESVAERLRSDADLLDRIVRDALGDGYRKPDARRLSNVSARVRGHIVTVTFSYSSFADRVGAGVLLVDYVHASGRESYGLDADRFTVVGPEGTRVVNDPELGHVGERPGSGRVGVDRVTWVSHSDEEYRVDTYVEDTYVAFASDDGLVQQVALRIALASRGLPAVLNNLAVLLPAGLAVVVGLAGYRAATVAGLRLRRPERVARAVFALGLLAIAHPFYAGSVPLINDDITALSAAGTAYALVGASALVLVATRRWESVRERPSRGPVRGRLSRPVPWWLLLAPAVATPPIGALLVTWLSYPDAPSAVSDTVLLGVPLAATLPLGYAVGRGDAVSQRRAVGATVALVILVTTRFVSFTDPPAVGGLIALVGFVLAVLGLSFGVPLYLLGESLARTVALDGCDR